MVRCAALRRNNKTARGLFSMRWKTARKLFPTSRRDTLICIGILSLAMLLCSMLRFLSEGDVYAALIFETAVIFVSRYTNGYLYGLVSSVIGVIGVNYMFTYPYFSLNFTISGYPLTFLVMITVAIIVGAMTTQLKQQEKVRAEAEKEKMRGNLLRAVSHDLRTPLTSIIGATNAVLDNDQALPPETKNELMQDVRDEAQWLLGVVENLLLVTRIGDEPTSLHKDMEAAEEIVSAAVQKFKKRFPGIETTVHVPQTLLMVPMDAILIQQVLLNLLENAALHGKHTTEIQIDVTNAGDAALFQVTDNGAGISREAMPKLFDGYFTHDDRGQEGGRRNMGIGLSVCLAIVRAHGGCLTAENRPEGGARFQFALPLEV